MSTWLIHGVKLNSKNLSIFLTPCLKRQILKELSAKKHAPFVSVVVEIGENGFRKDCAVSVAVVFRSFNSCISLKCNPLVTAFPLIVTFLCEIHYRPRRLQSRARSRNFFFLLICGKFLQVKQWLCDGHALRLRRTLRFAGPRNRLPPGPVPGMSSRGMSWPPSRLSR